MRRNGFKHLHLHQVWFCVCGRMCLQLIPTEKCETRRLIPHTQRTTRKQPSVHKDDDGQMGYNKNPCHANAAYT